MRNESSMPASGPTSCQGRPTHVLSGTMRQRTDLRSAATGLLLVALVGLAGCGKADGIRSYVIPKPLNAEDGRSSADAEPSRLLAAILQEGEASWFFKLTGDPEVLEDHAAEFRRFIPSVRFPETGTADWDLPEGWKRLPPSRGRYCTLQVPHQDTMLELSVTRLGNNGNAFDKFLLMNVNRWRGQLALPPVSADTLFDEIEKIELTAGGDAYVMDFIGEAAPSTGMPPFAGQGGGRMPSVTPGNSGSGEMAEIDLKFTAPPEWSTAPNDAFSQIAYAVSSDAGDVRVTVSKMPGRVPLVAQVPRWKAQVGLPRDDTLDDGMSTPVEVDGVTGTLLNFVGTEQANVIANVRKDGWDWFIKLRGPKDAVAAERKRFQAFIESARFSGGKE